MKSDDETRARELFASGEQLPSLENLRCFLAAARHLHFRLAAEEVHLTPAAFGQRIRQLEAQVNRALFERSTRSVRLTPEGLRLVPLAMQTLHGALRCVQDIRAEDDEELPVHLTLGTRFELGLSWVVPGIVELPEHLAHITIHLYFGSGLDILDRLQRGQLDAVITSAPSAHSDWTSEFLHREDYVFLGAPSLLARLPLDRVEDARHHTLLDINATLPLTRYLNSVVPRPLNFARVRVCGAGGAILELARAGLGVAVLPLYMAREALSLGQLQPLLPSISPLSDSFRLISRRDTLHARPIAQLAEFFRSFELR